MPAFVGSRRALLGGGVFDPFSLSPSFWIKADTGLTLSTTAYAGTGTVTQVGTAITGVSTLFLSEVKIGDTLTGTLISGTVTVITSNTALTVDASNSGAGAAYTINPTAGVSDRVTTAADQSGRGFNATQATASRKPALIPTGGPNGLKTIRFDAGNDVLALATGLGMFNNVPGVTIAVVSRSTNTPTTYRAAFTGSINANLNARCALERGNVSGHFSGGGRRLDANSYASVDGGTVTNGVYTIHIAVFDYANAALYVYQNGVLANSSLSFQTAGNSQAADSNAIFVGANTAGTNPFDGDICEVFVRAAYSSPSDVANLFGYLNGRWQVY